MLSNLFLIAAASAAVNAQGSNDGIPPLVDQHFTYPNLPYQVDSHQGVRGPQQGYNICNSTTEGPQSKCQTAFVNHIDDFCLWSAMGPNQLIGNTEGETVAYCTKPGRGTRIIPEGALTGVQFLRAPAYLQVTGHIKQEFIGLTPDDSGGELDPHGADLRGNPLGGLMFTNGFPSNGGKNDTFQQVIEWHNFMGGRMFCIKVCDPAGSDAPKYCQHIFDRIGCRYNAPADYTDNVFLACDSDNQDFPGVYTDAAGQVQTYSQPPESLGPIQTLPYDPKIPKTSNCVTYQSEVLYASLNSAAPTSSSSSAQTTGANTASGSSTGSQTSRTGTSTGAQQTGTGGALGVKAPQMGALSIALLGLVAGVAF